MRIYMLILALVLPALEGCTKSDSATPFGSSLVYMPQATFSGGTNNIYPVPSGFDSSATLNYVVDSVNHQIDVLLGVSRSGLAPYQNFSVQVYANADTVAALAASGVLPAGTLAIPAHGYTLPASVSVSGGAASFVLALDIATLQANQGQTLALVVGVSDPTLYQLNPAISSTIVEVNVSALPL
jgi:hypothetical protein